MLSSTVDSTRPLEPMSALDTLSPPITTLIRLDHAHVLAAFRRFRSTMAPSRKGALIANVCLALEIHAQLEEEIFYPALTKAAEYSEVLEKSVPEHEEMRELIGMLRKLEPQDPSFDESFRTLMRKLLHHVADEETVLLPQAEIALASQLSTLGARMTRRRIALLEPHMGEVARTTVQTFPIAAAMGAISLGFMLWLAMRALWARSRTF